MGIIKRKIDCRGGFSQNRYGVTVKAYLKPAQPTQVNYVTLLSDRSLFADPLGLLLGAAPVAQATRRAIKTISSYKTGGFLLPPLLLANRPQKSFNSNFTPASASSSSRAQRGAIAPGAIAICLQTQGVYRSLVYQDLLISRIGSFFSLAKC